MKQYSLSRRKLLIALGVGAVSAPLLTRQWWLNESRDVPLFITANDDNAGNHYVSGFDAKGHKHFQLSTDLRGHGLVVNPAQKHRALMFARRPGTVAYEIDLKQSEMGTLIDCAPGRHFFGHGCYSLDGQTLYTSENDYENGRGVIVVRDSSDYRILNEFSSHGIGPHEIRLLSDGKTLVVANGGIQTHPDYPRKKLNLSTMQPALSYIDVENGQLLGEYRPDNHQLSIRHLDVSQDDRVMAIMQYQGAKTDKVPLVALHHGEDQLQPLMADEQTQVAMNQYTASACINSENGIAGVTCPRGNLVTFWDTRQGHFIKALEIKDAGGIALAADGRFVITTGRGEVHRISTTTLTADRSPLKLAETRCDNHLSIAMSV